MSRITELSDPSKVQEAIAECDRIGREAFLHEHGFGPAQNYVLIYRGREYDSKAIAGVAFKKQFPSRDMPTKFGGLDGAVKALRDMEFVVVGRSEVRDYLNGAKSPTAGGEAQPVLDWTKLIQAAVRSFADPEFDERERKYKMAIATRIREIMVDSQDGTGWIDDLRRALSSERFYNHRYNLTTHWDHTWLLKLSGDQARAVAEAFDAYLSIEGAVDRMTVWATTVKESAPEENQRPGSVIALGSVFNFAIDPTRLPIVKAFPFSYAELATGFKVVDSDPAYTYAQHLEFSELAEGALKSAGVEIRDMLDVQSVIWEFHRAKELARKAKGLEPPTEPISRRQGWIRDELILAMDLVQRTGSRTTPKEIDELIESLRKLPIEAQLSESSSFRDRREVEQVVEEMSKLMAGAQTTEQVEGDLSYQVVQHFRNHPSALSSVADQIRTITTSISGPGVFAPDPGVSEAPEGRILTGIHTYRERNRRLAESKKRETLETYGKLSCEGCGFVFADRYGHRCEGFIECHHLTPVSELQYGAKTNLKDLALVCANCHRMIHRSQPWLTMDELRNLIREDATTEPL